MNESQKIKEMKEVLSVLIALNKKLQGNSYQLLKLRPMQKEKVRPPYRFYLN